MLRLALTALVIAIVAAVFGFTGIAVTFAAGARILFVIFIAVFLVMLIVHLVGGARGR